MEIKLLFFPNSEKKSQSSKKPTFFYFWRWGFSFSHHKHKLHDDNLQLHLISPSNFLWQKYVLICWGFFTKNEIIVHCNKFPNLGVYPATFPNLKGPRAPSQYCKKKIPVPLWIECSGSVVECLTHDRGVVGLSLSSITALCRWARHINPCLVVVQPRKTRPNMTEKLLTGK